jgi:LPS O-antigen subunit length determinant protein (WzzB/FepE family)
MRHKAISQLLFITLALPITFLASPSSSANAQVTQTTTAQLSPVDKDAVKRFERRVKDYVKVRNRVKAKLPKLSKDSTPAQIETYRENFEAAMRNTRTGAKRGDIFNHDGSDYIRRTLKANFKGRDRTELREIVFDGETTPPLAMAAVKVRVNYPYPDAVELVEMPPTVLLNLPQLPPEVKYRFVGRNLLLVDRDNNLILDYMTNALP